MPNVEFEYLACAGSLGGPKCETVTDFLNNLAQSCATKMAIRSIRVHYSWGFPRPCTHAAPQTPLLASLGHGNYVRDGSNDPASATYTYTNIVCAGPR